MFRIHQFGKGLNEVKSYQVDAHGSSLCSRFVYLVFHQQTRSIYVWYGKGSTLVEKQASKKLAQMLSPVMIIYMFPFNILIIQLEYAYYKYYERR
jgi:hypothetical protein